MVDMPYVCRDPGTRAHGMTTYYCTPIGSCPSRCVVLKPSLLPGWRYCKVLANQNLLKQSHLPTSTLNPHPHHRDKKMLAQARGLSLSPQTSVVICHRCEEIAGVLSFLLDAACIPEHLALHLALVTPVTSWSVDHTVPKIFSRPQTCSQCVNAKASSNFRSQAKSYIALGIEPLNPSCLSPVERQSGTHI